jgi:hypothetical protein
LPLSKRLLKELGDYWRAQRQGKRGHDIPWLFLGYRGVTESSTDTAHDRLTLGAILRAFLPALLHLLKLGNHKVRVLWHLAACGTPALGANLFACPHCPHRHWAPRSCGDRHCPRCLAAKSWQWLEKQTRSLLPISYYHCVFTLPAELNSLVLANQRRLYPLLSTAPRRVCWSLGATDSTAIWESPLSYIPRDKSSTSIPIFTALSPAQH